MVWNGLFLFLLLFFFLLFLNLFLLFLSLLLLLLHLLLPVRMVMAVVMAVMTRFRSLRLLDFSAADDHAVTLGFVTRTHWLVLDLPDHIHAIDHFAKNDVLSVEMRARNRSDKELGPVRIRSRVRHAQKTRFCVFVRKGLVGKSPAIYTFTSSSVLRQRDNPMPTNLVKSPPWIIKSLITR